MEDTKEMMKIAFIGLFGFAALGITMVITIWLAKVIWKFLNYIY